MLIHEKTSDTPFLGCRSFAFSRFFVLVEYFFIGSQLMCAHFVSLLKRKRIPKKTSRTQQGAACSIITLIRYPAGR